MLKWRLVSFPLLLAILGGIFFAPARIGGLLFFISVTLVSTMAAYELLSMLNNSGIKSAPRLGSIFTALFVGTSIFFICDMEEWWEISLAAVFLVSLLLPGLMILFKRDFSVERIFNTIGASIVAALPIFIASTIYDSDSRMIMLYVILATKAMDTGGYIFGMLSNKIIPGGNHKLCPSVSPKKSWEGVVGGILLSLLVGFIFYRTECVVDYTLVQILILSALLAVASIFGDLTESSLKRKCGIKDSGSWIPGMGGALDVMDSFIYTGAVFYSFEMVVKLFSN